MECKYCSKLCHKYGLKNHETYCELNPNRKDKSGKNNPMYGKSSNASNQYIKARELGISINITEETRLKIGNGQRGKIWNQEAKDKHKLVMSKTAKDNPDSYSAANVNGRVKKIDYNGVSLDGSWELLVVQWFDSNNIKWIRNTKGFKYEWNGDRTYYPDFYKKCRKTHSSL